MKIAMAVREAAVTQFLHGNAYDPNKKVTLAFERNAQDLVIVIRDQGKGLDASKIPDPLAPDNLMKDLGAGHFPDTLVHGCGGDPPVPDRHRT